MAKKIISDKIVAVLWQEISPGEWINTGFKFPLDAQSIITQANVWNIREYGHVPYLEGVTPGISTKPLNVPLGILNLESPAEGIKKAVKDSKKFFEGSSKFFANITREEIEPDRKVKRLDPQLIKRGSSLAVVLESLLVGVSKDDLTMPLAILQTALNQRGYSFSVTDTGNYKLKELRINYGN